MAEMTVDTATPIEGSVRRYTEQHPCQFNYLRTCNSKLDPSQTNNLETKGCTSSSNDLLWEVAMKVAESLEGFSGDNDLFLTLSKLFVILSVNSPCWHKLANINKQFLIIASETSSDLSARCMILKVNQATRMSSNRHAWTRHVKDTCIRVQ